MKAVLFEEGFTPNLGSIGNLSIDDAGIRWTPGWLARLRRRPAKTIHWSEVEGADVVPAWGEGRPSRLLTIRTAAGKMMFSLGDLEAEEAGRLLGQFLEPGR